MMTIYTMTRVSSPLAPALHVLGPLAGEGAERDFCSAGIHVYARESSFWELVVLLVVVVGVSQQG